MPRAWTAEEPRPPAEAGAGEKQRPESEQESIEWREVRSAPPGAIENQELLFHEKAVGDNGPHPAGPQ